MAVGIASLEHEITALNETDIGKSLPHTTQCLSIGTFRSNPEIANAYRLIRLGKRHAERCGLRPRRRRAAEQRDEVSALHSITSSAVARSVGGMWRPSDFAVLPLITSWNFVGRSIGSSCGFAPRKILST